MKRKVILYISMSLDGFIADETGSVNWINGQDENYESDYGYDNFIKNVDTVILGYKTYRQIVDELSPDEWVYQDLQSYVFTSKGIEDKENIKFVNGNLISFVEKLKQQKGKDIWICGGANLANQLVRENMIDEYHITIIPVILGSGTRLFQKENATIKLVLKESKEENGIVTNVYAKR